MLTFVLRLLALGALVVVFELSPMAGVAAVAAGYGYLIGHRMRLPITR